MSGSKRQPETNLLFNKKFQLNILLLTTFGADVEPLVTNIYHNE